MIRSSRAHAPLAVIVTKLGEVHKQTKVQTSSMPLRATALTSGSSEGDRPCGTHSYLHVHLAAPNDRANG